MNVSELDSAVKDGIQLLMLLLRHIYKGKHLSPQAAKYLSGINVQ